MYVAEKKKPAENTTAEVKKKQKKRKEEEKRAVYFKIHRSSSLSALNSKNSISKANTPMCCGLQNVYLEKCVSMIEDKEAVALLYSSN